MKPNIALAIMLCTHLVCPAYEVEVVLVQELGRHLRAEGERHAAVVLAPAHRVLVGVGPEQVAQQPLVRHVRRPHYPPGQQHIIQTVSSTRICSLLTIILEH